MLKIEQSKIIIKYSQLSRFPCTKISKARCTLHTFILSYTPYTTFIRLKSSLAATTRAQLLSISLELLKHDTTSKHFLSLVKNLTWILLQQNATHFIQVFSQTN